MEMCENAKKKWKFIYIYKNFNAMKKIQEHYSNAVVVDIHKL